MESIFYIKVNSDYIYIGSSFVFSMDRDISVLPEHPGSVGYLFRLVVCADVKSMKRIRRFIFLDLLLIFYFYIFTLR